MDVVGFGAESQTLIRQSKEAAVKAIKEGFTKYTPASGMLELKEAVCRKLKRQWTGIQAGKYCYKQWGKAFPCKYFSSHMYPGDEVIIPCPCWVSYPEMIKMASESLLD